MNEKKWKLDGKQSRELRLVLASAFTNESNLKRMVWENLEKNLNDIANEGNLDDRRFSLIMWANSVGKVEELVIAAACEKSGNPDIQDFVEKYIDNLIKFEISEFSKESLVSLITILKEIVEFIVVGNSGKNLLPQNITVNRSQEIQILEQRELSNWFKCFTVLKLLLEDYPLLNQRSSILILVEHLLKEESVDRSLKEQLKEWLHKIDPNFNCQPSGSEQISISASSQPASGALQAYLMITVNPEKKTQIRAIASLLCISPTGTRKEIPVHLNPESNERGVLCTWKKLPQIVAQFIDRSISVDLSRLENLLGCNYYEMTIELFLPVDYLCEPVDCWDIKDSYGDKNCLGSRYALVVRSYDRVAKPPLKNAFSKSWHRAKDLLRQNPKPEQLQANIQHIESINCAELEFLREKLSEKIGAKITCSLSESQPEMIKFLKKLLDSGVPIAFWTRCPEIPSCEVRAGIDQFLTTELLLNSCELLQKVRQERALAFGEMREEHWGKHLTVLWDDWERMPTLESF